MSSILPSLLIVPRSIGLAAGLYSRPRPMHAWIAIASVLYRSICCSQVDRAFAGSLPSPRPRDRDPAAASYAGADHPSLPGSPCRLQPAQCRSESARRTGSLAEAGLAPSPDRPRGSIITWLMTVGNLITWLMTVGNAWEPRSQGHKWVRWSFFLSPFCNQIAWHVQVALACSSLVLLLMLLLESRRRASSSHRLASLAW